MKNEKMEIFKNNLNCLNLSNAFIKKAIEYFAELEEEKNVSDYKTVEDVIDYYNQCGSFTFNTHQSEENLIYREDIALLKEEYPDLLDLNLYFKNVEAFEISILYLLYYNFYPEEDNE